MNHSLKPKVLHVTEALNGGVVTALSALFNQYSEFDHILLADSHSWDPLPSEEEVSDFGVRFVPWKGSKFAKMIQLRRICKSESPPVIHLHSSWAGLLGRLLPSSGQVVYSAHGFAFQRRDIPPLSRSLFRLVEAALQFRTNHYHAFWPSEVDFVRGLGYPERKIVRDYVLAHELMVGPDSELQANNQLSNRVLGIGRLTAAKGIDLFAEVARVCEELDFLWIGDSLGGDALPSNMRAVEWMSRADLLKELSWARALLITSQWEAGPATLYEAVSSGVPVVARLIPATTVLTVCLENEAAGLSAHLRELGQPAVRSRVLSTQIASVREALDQGHGDLDRVYRGGA